MKYSDKKSDCKRMVTRKQIGWFSIFQVSIMIGLILIMVSELVGMWHLKRNVLEMRTQISSLEKGYNLRDYEVDKDILYEYISRIDEKSDAAIDKVVAIVSVLFTVVTLFGGLVAFKAPKDIDSRLYELDREIKQAKEITEESRYLVKIREAMQEDTKVERIQELTSILYY